MLKINKTIMAFFIGYILFNVNGKFFYRYNTALKQRKSIKGNVFFDGLHIIRGWECFFVRSNSLSDKNFRELYT